MGYRMYYGEQILYDPYTDYGVFDATLSAQVNTASYLDFSITMLHPLYSTLKEQDDKVYLYLDDAKLFEGLIYSISDDIEGTRSISCKDALSYLGDTRVRPYSTYRGDENVEHPSNVAGEYFEWLISEHNSHVMNSSERFIVGANEANQLVSDPYIYRANAGRPTTAEEISDKILDSMGGYLVLRYDGDARYLDLFADIQNSNAQVIDFGVNLKSFTRTTSTEDLYTAVLPVGGTPEEEEDESEESDETDETETEEEEPQPVTLSELSDGVYDPDPDYFKRGDVVYSSSRVARYGYREYLWTNDDILTAQTLLDRSVKLLNQIRDPKITIEVKAVDLSLFVEGYHHLMAGEAVRVRAKPFDVDEYLLVDSVEIDLQSPENTTYTLGQAYDTLTGGQSKKLSSLTSAINSNIDAVSSLTQSQKDMAKEYDGLADGVIVDILEQYYNSDSPDELVGGEWADENKWVDGKYVWNRRLVTFGDGHEEYAPSEDGVCISGNTGPQGLQGLPGEDGLPGEPGEDGLTSYFHIKYSEVPEPTALDMTENPSDYIGTYVDYDPEDSTDPSMYTWSRFKGMDGEQGIPGENGEDGKTSYLHIAYADSADGTVGFSTTDSDDKLYIGQYTDFNAYDSVYPVDYSWTLIKGSDGEQGQDGVGVSSVVEEWYLSTNPNYQLGGSWSQTPPVISSGRYLWSRVKTTYTDGTIKYTDPVRSKAIENAQSTANDAEKVATNYLSFDSSSGLIVADQTGSSVGSNVQILSDSINIRNGSVANAIFSPNRIELGESYEDSSVEFCGGSSSIGSRIVAADGDWNYVDLLAKNLGGTRSIMRLACSAGSGIGDDPVGVYLTNGKTSTVNSIQLNPFEASHTFHGDGSYTVSNPYGNDTLSGLGWLNMLGGAVDSYSISTSADLSTWSWVKYRNGIAICYKNHGGATAVNIAWGNVYRSSDGLDAFLDTFPFTFKYAPFMVNAISYAKDYGGTTYRGIFAMSNGAPTTTQTSAIMLICPVSRSTLEVHISRIAIGRWK